MTEPTQTIPVRTEALGAKPLEQPRLSLVAALFLSCGLGILPGLASAAEPSRGVAILASDVGRAYPVPSLEEFITRGGFSSVIIDWAWITHHWDRTDFAAVRQLVARLKTKHIVVAAMYRPRFLESPTVPEQVDQAGQPVAAQGHYPCLSSAAAREWSWSWGSRILTNCPQFDEIVVYNPLDLCQCATCRSARVNDPYGPIWNFLLQARNSWHTANPVIKLGVVSSTDNRFWVRGQNVVDTARPFFVVRSDADIPANVAGILNVRAVLGDKMGPTLAKVTWEPDEIISMDALAAFAQAAREHDFACVLWTFDTLLLSDAYDPAVVSQLLRLDYRQIERSLRALRGNTDAAGVPSLAFPPTESVIAKLPWPHQQPGLSPGEIDRINREVWVINNSPLYQSDHAGTWSYFHGGLDIVLTNGTPIYAMKEGWIKAVTNSAVVVADKCGAQPGFGWSYTHLHNSRVHVGDFVTQGTLLGEVNFEGLAHIHLERIFSQGAYWPNWRYTCFPDDHFTFIDRVAPTILTPFYFFENNSDRLLVPQQDGRMVVGGDIDIVVGMRDGGEFAHSKDSGFGDRLAVVRINYSIRPAQAGTGQTRHFPSFDFRKLCVKTGAESAARGYSTQLVRITYKHFGLFGTASPGHQSFSYYIISNCPTEAAPAELKSTFTNCCWQTAGRDTKTDAPLYPDGDYILEVTAFDSHGNSTAQSMKVTVDNAARYLIQIKAPQTRQVDVKHRPDLIPSDTDCSKPR